MGHCVARSRCMKTELSEKIETGILNKDREAAATLLNRLLADEFVLLAKTRNFHWNVTGMDFTALHGLLQKQYEDLDATVDELAERVRALGHTPLGSLREFLEAARPREVPGKLLAPEKMVGALLEDHESVIRNLRQDLEACANKHHDAGTGDLLTGLMEKHEKTAWMLRSHLG